MKVNQVGWGTLAGLVDSVDVSEQTQVCISSDNGPQLDLRFRTCRSTSRPPLTLVFPDS